MINLKGLAVGSYVARRELVALLGELGLEVSECVQMGSTLIVEVEREGAKNLLEFKLGNLVEDNTKAHSSHDYREVFKPVMEVLEAQVLKFTSFS